MPMLDGKQIVLTGAAGGLGTIIAEQLRARGAMVTGIDRVPAQNVDDFISADLASLEGLQAVSDALGERQVDILVNLAGIQFFGPLQDQSLENLWAGYAVNLIAPAALSRAVLPGMKARGDGQIVNVGSVFGAIPFAHFVSYSSAKAGLKGLSDSLRRELSGTGVAVTHIAPRAVRTALNSAKVLAFAAVTRMTMDPPGYVATRIIEAMAMRRRDVVIGFPESLFVRINALAPRIVDRALVANDRKAAALFT